MQLGEKNRRHSVYLLVNPGNAAYGHDQRTSAFTLFEPALSIVADTSRMNSRVEKARLDVRCSHCSKQIKWAWLIQYHSFRYTQMVYVCSECEQVIKIENAPNASKESSVFSDPRLPRRK